MAQDADGVRIDIERGDIQGGAWQPLGDKRTIQAKWVVGADGANSFVRKALDVEMPDLGFQFDWLVVDVIPHEKREWKPLTWQLCDPARPTSIVQSGPGRRRWEFMLLPGEKAVDMNKAEVSWKLLAPWNITPDNATLERHAVYTFRGQWAKDWRRGRALLAGDAAHLMPPFAGQGMCSGMRDSMALAWRLDAVLRGQLGESVLDSYGPERCGHVQEMINFSIELGHVSCITDPAAAAERDRAILAAQAQPGYQPPPPPQPRLGPGLWQPDAPGAGLLGVQGEIEFEGRRALFDDVFGAARHAVIARDAATATAISSINRAALERVGGIVTYLGDGGFSDVGGSYAAWLNQLGCAAVLARPDFYLHGGAHDAAELNQLLDGWRRALAIDT